MSGERGNELAERITRILTLIPYVQRHPGVRIEELARFAGCTPEEILRDLDAVLMCGTPPYYPHDYIGVYVEGGRVMLGFAEHFRRPVRLTLQEALALKVMLSAFGGEGRARSLMKKIDAALAGGIKRKVDEAGERIQILGPYHSLAQRLAAIERAVAARKEIEIEYYTASRDEMTRRTVRPYAIVEHQGVWYMIGFCKLRGKELPFRVDRIKALRQLQSGFEIPPDFDVKKYTRTEIYLPWRKEREVKVLFSPDISRWIRENAEQGTVEERDDGAVVLTIKTNHPEWVMRWVLQFGDRAEIVSPPSLRREMVSLCRRMLKNYEGAVRSS